MPPGLKQEAALRIRATIPAGNFIEIYPLFKAAAERIAAVKDKVTVDLLDF